MDFPGGKWLRPRAPSAGGTGSIPGPGTKIPHDAAKKKKQKPEGTHSRLSEVGWWHLCLPLARSFPPLPARSSDLCCVFQIKLAHAAYNNFGFEVRKNAGETSNLCAWD